MQHLNCVPGARSVFIVLCLLLPPAVSAENHNQLTSAEAAAGWVLLFDGESLDQWRTYRKPAPGLPWQSIDGELTLTQRGGGDLITKQTWADFELKLEWKISEGGNSGVFILASEESVPIYVRAPEIQILDDARHADNKLDTHRSGSLYDMIAAPAESQRDAGAWNQMTVLHNGGELKIWQNDVLVADIRIGGERWNQLVAASKFADWEGFGANASGHIGLQDHGDRVSFRNLIIRSLTERP